jgi:hypothetical protein
MEITFRVPEEVVRELESGFQSSEVVRKLFQSKCQRFNDIIKATAGSTYDCHIFIHKVGGSNNSRYPWAKPK